MKEDYWKISLKIDCKSNENQSNASYRFSDLKFIMPLERLNPPLFLIYLLIYSLSRSIASHMNTHSVQNRFSITRIAYINLNINIRSLYIDEPLTLPFPQHRRIRKHNVRIMVIRVIQFDVMYFWFWWKSIQLMVLIFMRILSCISRIPLYAIPLLVAGNFEFPNGL